MLWGPGETSTQGSGRMCQESKVTVAQSHVTSTSHTSPSCYPCPCTLPTLGGVSGGVEAHTPVAGRGDQVGATTEVQSEV